MLKEMTSSTAFRCVQAWLLEKPAADAASLAAALMVQRPPARAREDALLQAEAPVLPAPHCWPLWGAPERERKEDNSPQAAGAQLRSRRAKSCSVEEEGNRETWRREELERRVEILEEENRNLRRRTH